jgi:membrane protein implicated in regulation of membrane protease activity
MNGQPWIETIYWGATIIGGTLFLLRTIMLLVGGGLGGDDFDTHFDGHVDAGFGDVHTDIGDVHTDFDTHFDGHVDTGLDAGLTDHAALASFKLLSMQGLTAFFMMFGLVGLALLRANLAVALTVIGGTAAGLFTVWVISILFSQMRRLQSEGTLDINNAVGQVGSVYLTIPKGGSGQIQVTVQGSLRMFDAISQDGKPIPTGQKIRVSAVVDGKTLSVTRI